LGFEYWDLEFLNNADIEIDVEKAIHILSTDHFLRILQERRKETPRAINIPDMEKRKKRRISLSFMTAYLLSNNPT